jgi:hypothetical protein
MLDSRDQGIHPICAASYHLIGTISAPRRPLARHLLLPESMRVNVLHALLQDLELLLASISWPGRREHLTGSYDAPAEGRIET